MRKVKLEVFWSDWSTISGSFPAPSGTFDKKEQPGHAKSGCGSIQTLQANVYGRFRLQKQGGSLSVINMNHRVPPVYILIHGHTDHLVKRHPGALCAERLLASEPSGQLPQHHQCGGHRHQLQGVLLGPRVLRVERCQNWNFWVVGVDTECL